MSEGSVEIKDLVKTYVDDRGRPTFTAACASLRPRL